MRVALSISDRPQSVSIGMQCANDGTQGGNDRISTAIITIASNKIHGVVVLKAIIFQCDYRVSDR